MNPGRRTLVLGTAAAALGAGAARALEAPRGPVVLTVTGKVALPNDGTLAVFDMAMLERMRQDSFTTRTPWYTQPRKFTGPLLRDVFAAAGAHGTTVRAWALNDYRVDIPFEDSQQHGEYMPIRDKGPLFIIYPFDSKPQLKNAVYYSRSAWQLKLLDVQ